MAICRGKQLRSITIPCLSLCSQMAVNLLPKHRVQSSETGVQTPVLRTQSTSEGKHTTPAPDLVKNGVQPPFKCCLQGVDSLAVPWHTEV